MLFGLQWRRSFLCIGLFIFLLGGALIQFPLFYMVHSPLVSRYAELHVRHQAVLVRNNAFAELFVTRNTHIPTTSVITVNEYVLKDIATHFSSDLSSLHLPSVYNFLPHLLDNPGSLQLAHCVSGGRSGVSIVIGIIVNSNNLKHLANTLLNIIDGVESKEEDEILIVVLVTEINLDKLLQVSSQVQSQFPKQVKLGMLEIIAPHASYYPSTYTSVKRPKKKQEYEKENLDICFMMMYSQPKGKFYIPILSGMVTEKHFITTMKNFAENMLQEHPLWIVLEFYQFGVIGSMFKCSDLPRFTNFILMFYREQSSEQLMQCFIYSMSCHSHSNTKCEQASNDVYLKYERALFKNSTVSSMYFHRKR